MKSQSSPRNAFSYAMQTSVRDASGLPASTSAAASAGSKVNGGRSAGPIAPVTRAALTSAKVEIPSAAAFASNSSSKPERPSAASKSAWSLQPNRPTTFRRDFFLFPSPLAPVSTSAGSTPTSSGISIASWYTSLHRVSPHSCAASWHAVRVQKPFSFGRFSFGVARRNLCRINTTRAAHSCVFSVTHRRNSGSSASVPRRTRAAQCVAIRSISSLSSSIASGVFPESSGVFDSSRHRSQVAHAASTHRSNRPSFPFSQFKHSVASPTN
mmetsp:Transcript_4110/g.11095  ORF Transcript_4110/g.11095 Transcript_4110/m.11095 type:complete len:269 (+) Transcript_4110:779-1585(+)